MSSLGIGRGSSTRTVRKIEPPRPLKTSVSTTASNDTKKSLSPLVLPAKAIDSAEKLLLLMDAVVTGILSDDETSLRAENKSILTANIITLCESLKVSGAQLEGSLYRGQLDKAFLTFREGMVRNNLELEARVHLLDILELRECNWLPRKNSKPIIVKNLMLPLDEDPVAVKFQNSLPESTTHLGSDELIKRSGKYRDKPSKSSKNYCKEEIIIRNADSGKVMGIKGRRVHMIEQLSDTIISFQKVQPTFKERLVQITGPNEEKLSYATHLIENTIRNNSSPIRELGDSELGYSSDESYEKLILRDETPTNWKYLSASSDNYQYKHKVTYNDSVLMVTGNDYDFVTLAKEVLDDYFSKLARSESNDYYSGSENLMSLAGDYLENDVFVETVYGDETIVEFSNHNGAGDNEGSLLQQLHKELNGLEIESESSPANDIISISDSIEEVEDEKESTIKAINFPRLVYTKEFLLGCRKSPMCQKEPENFARVKENFPKIIKSDLRRRSSSSPSSSPFKSENNIRTET